jgi:hypothetical protein
MEHDIVAIRIINEEWHMSITYVTNEAQNSGSFVRIQWNMRSGTNVACELSEWNMEQWQSNSKKKGQ